MARISEIKSDITSATRPEPLVISRHFAAPRELVFKAWSSAEHMKRWFSPEGYSVPEAEIDFRAGGVFAVCMRMPHGEDHWIKGAFDEVRAPDRLAFTAGVISGGQKRCSGRDVRFIARPPHRTVRAAFPHTAPTSGE
jgi:uncharacterized protein YndB with AHSA1/START domain